MLRTKRIGEHLVNLGKGGLLHGREVGEGGCKIVMAVLEQRQ